MDSKMAPIGKKAAKQTTMKSENAAASGLPLNTAAVGPAFDLTDREAEDMFHSGRVSNDTIKLSMDCGIPYGAQLGTRTIGLLFRCGIKLNLLSSMWPSIFHTSGQIRNTVVLKEAYQIYDPEDHIWRYVYHAKSGRWLIPDFEYAPENVLDMRNGRMVKLNKHNVWQEFPTLTVNVRNGGTRLELRVNEQGVLATDDNPLTLPHCKRFDKDPSAVGRPFEVQPLGATAQTSKRANPFSNGDEEGYQAKRTRFYEATTATFAKQAFPQSTDDDIKFLSGALIKAADGVWDLFEEVYKARTGNTEVQKKLCNEAEKRGREAARKEFSALNKDISTAKDNVEAFSEGLKGFLSKEQLGHLQDTSKALTKFIKLAKE